MIKIREVLISKETYHTTKKGNKVYIRNGKIIVPTSLTIHSTGNLQSTAVNERNWLINPTNNSGASWNICVDEKEAIIAIPLNEKSNHSGDTTGNNTSIGLEICESGDREKTLRNAIQVSAWVLKRFNLTYKDLKQHFNWNKKNCPRILRETGRWEWFVNEVKKEMEGQNMPKYNTLEEVPEWGKSTVEKLFNKGALKGDENGNLNISEELLRTFVIHDRLGLYDLPIYT